MLYLQLLLTVFERAKSYATNYKLAVKLFKATAGFPWTTRS